MKNLSLLVFALLALGCGRNEFDVSPDQVTRKVQKGSGGGPGGIDMNHLPPGAVKHEHTYKKGDRLPDGTIADGDRKVVTVEINKGGEGQTVDRIMTRQTLGK